MLRSVIKPLVYLKFLDHASGTANDVRAITCELFGILKKEDDVAFYVVSWICDHNLSEPNSDGYCVLKSTVLEYREIVEKEVRKHGKANEKGHRPVKKAAKANRKAKYGTNR